MGCQVRSSKLLHTMLCKSIAIHLIFGLWSQLGNKPSIEILQPRSKLLVIQPPLDSLPFQIADDVCALPQSGREFACFLVPTLTTKRNYHSTRADDRREPTSACEFPLANLQNRGALFPQTPMMRPLAVRDLCYGRVRQHMAPSVPGRARDPSSSTPSQPFAPALPSTRLCHTRPELRKDTFFEPHVRSRQSTTGHHRLSITGFEVRFTISRCPLKT